MNTLLQEIMGKYIISLKESNTLHCNCKNLKKNMSESERKLLLRIIDEKDLMIEKTAHKNFEKGFCIGVQLAIEILTFNI